jgi:hypothetical protein
LPLLPCRPKENRTCVLNFDAMTAKRRIIAVRIWLYYSSLPEFEEWLAP